MNTSFTQNALKIYPTLTLSPTQHSCKRSGQLEKVNSHHKKLINSPETALTQHNSEVLTIQM